MPAETTASLPVPGANKDLRRSIAGVVSGLIASVLTSSQIPLTPEQHLAIVTGVMAAVSAGLTWLGKKNRQGLDDTGLLGKIF